MLYVDICIVYIFKYCAVISNGTRHFLKIQPCNTTVSHTPTTLLIYHPCEDLLQATTDHILEELTKIRHIHALQAYVSSLIEVECAKSLLENAETNEIVREYARALEAVAENVQDLGNEYTIADIQGKQSYIARASCWL